MLCGVVMSADIYAARSAMYDTRVGGEKIQVFAIAETNRHFRTIATPFCRSCS